MTLPPEIVAVLIVAGLAILALSCFVLGLYVGERGRRKDAQRREGVLHVDEPERAEVITPGGMTPAPTESELGEAPDRFIRETMEETGCSEAEARMEWRILLGRTQGDGGGSGWVQS